MKIAIIDCGTNTFNLLVAELKDHHLSFIYHDKAPVKIGKGGIEERIIMPDAYARALHAMDTYAQAIERLKVDKVLATSTSAFRSTDNGPALKEEILKTTGIDVRIVSGDQEAEYIYKGVTWALPPEQGKNYLVMDIGGGSTEFILYNHDRVFFKESYLLGASRLIEKFKPSDPLTHRNIDDLNAWFEELMAPSLIAACKAHPPDYLVGSSGFFDTLRSICYYRAGKNDARLLESINCDIELAEFDDWYDLMLPMDLAERMNIEGMTAFRAEMMGISMVLTRYVVQQTGVKKIINTEFALKEGVLLEFLEKENLSFNKTDLPMHKK